MTESSHLQCCLPPWRQPNRAPPSPANVCRASRSGPVVSHQAIPLARAMRHAKARLGGEIVRARLCRGGNSLVYVLTVLARDGKVTRAIIDAASGKMLVGG